MKKYIATFAILTLFIGGCTTTSSPELVAIPVFASTSAQTASKDDTFEAKYQSIKAAMAPTDNKKKGGEKAQPPTDSAEVMKLLRTKCVQSVVDDVYAATASGKSQPGLKGVTLTNVDFEDFHRALCTAKDSLLDDVSKGKGTKELDKILIAYFKEYGAGDFVDRNGTEIAKPSFDSGINNETIIGIATVFWEGLFDYWTNVPVFAEKDDKEVIKTTYKGPVDGEVTPVYTRSHEPVYLTDEHRQPTALKLSVTTMQRLVDDHQPGIDAREAKAIKVASNWTGKRANAGAALIFGFLGKVNIGFILMPGFSVGDNKTLIEVVKTSAEIATRRGTQAVLYQAFMKSSKDEAVDRVADALK